MTKEGYTKFVNYVYYFDDVYQYTAHLIAIVLRCHMAVFLVIVVLYIFYGGLVDMQYELF